MLIIYYAPKATHSGIDSDWLYGVDLIREVEAKLKFNFLKVQYFSRKQMKFLYGVATCLLRPTRHDGYSFSVQEALHYGLPVLHTYPIPGVILIKPEINDIREKLCNLQSEL